MLVDPREVFKFSPQFNVIPTYIGSLAGIPEWKRSELIQYLKNPLIVDVTYRISEAGQDVEMGYRIALMPLGKPALDENLIGFQGIDIQSNGALPITALLEGKYCDGNNCIALTVIGRYNDLVDKGEYAPEMLFSYLIQTLEES